MSAETKNLDAEAVEWLRDVLAAMLDAGAVPRWIERGLRSFMRRLPDSLLEAWANALNIDVQHLREMMPDAGDRLRGEAGKEAVRTCVGAHQLVPLARTFRSAVKTAIRWLRSGSLPVDAEAVQRDLPALALTHCTPEGYETAGAVASILGTASDPPQLIAGYAAALARGDRQPLAMTDGTVVESSYGRWIGCRLQEVRRLIGVEPPSFRVEHSERTPLWNGFWNNMWRK